MTARTFTGTLPTGVPVLVTVHDPERVAEIAFKHDGRWCAPVELAEEA